MVPVISTNLQDAVVFIYLLYAAWPDHGVPRMKTASQLAGGDSLLHGLGS